MSALDLFSIVGHNAQSFDSVCKIFDFYDKNQVLYALYEKKLGEEDIKIMLCQVREGRFKMRREYISLNRFSREFPWEFATANNQCFDIVSTLLNRIRSTSKASRVQYNKFRPRLHKRAYDQNGQQIPKKCNYLLKGTAYEKDLFYSEYPPIVDELCEEIELLYTDIVAINVICRETLNTVRDIQSDKDKCKEVYDKHVEKIKKTIDWNNGTIIIEMKSTSLEEIAKIRESAKDLKEFAYQEYHKINDKDFKQYVIKITFMRGTDNGLEGLEKVLWANNPEKGKQVRLIISHLEEIMDHLHVFKSEGKHKIPGGFIAWLMEWSEKESTDTNFFQYLRDTFKSTKYTLPSGTSAFSNQKSKNAKKAKDAPVWKIEKETFLKEINSYFSTDSARELQISAM